jgi:hypothetical protein
MNARLPLSPIGDDPAVLDQARRKRRRPFATAGRLPFADERRHLGAHAHQPTGGFRAILVMIDQVADRGLDIRHFRPQRTDFASDFINSIVHGLLEQK